MDAGDLVALDLPQRRDHGGDEDGPPRRIVTPGTARVKADHLVYIIHEVELQAARGEICLDDAAVRVFGPSHMARARAIRAAWSGSDSGSRSVKVGVGRGAPEPFVRPGVRPQAELRGDVVASLPEVVAAVRVNDEAGPAQGGADLPQPPRFLQPAAGLSADVHIASAANNVVKGYLSTPDVARVQNLMIETRKVEPGMAPKDAIKITENVDFPTYLKAVEAANSKNDPTTQAIRIKRPVQAPDFGVDARGFLVIVAHDLQLDIPVPAQVANSRLGGTPAKVYRLIASTAEFVFELKPVTDPATGAIRLTGNLRDFTPAPGSKVLAINEDEVKALPLDPFRSVFVFQGFAQAIRSKPLDVPLENLKLKGYAITSVSDLDPTGWIRIVLTPTGERPLAQSN